MAITIRRNIKLTYPAIVEPISVVYGTNDTAIAIHVDDATIAGYTAVARNLTGESRFEQSATVAGDTVTFTPPAGFFLRGRNKLQIELKSGAKAVYTFIVPVFCEENIMDAGTLEETKSVESFANQAADSAAKAAKSESAAKAAQTAAETAQGKAESAKTTAEDAKGKAETAANTATTKANAAADSATAAGEAQVAAEGAKDAANTAKSEAESAKREAVTAQTAAEAAADTATTQASTATAKAGEASDSAAAAESAQEAAEQAKTDAHTAAEQAKSSASAAAESENKAKEYETSAESSAQKAAESAAKAEAVAGGQFVPLSEKGQQNGVAELDGTGKVPNDQLPDIPPGTKVKGNAEEDYRTGEVELSPDNFKLGESFAGAAKRANITKGDSLSTAFEKLAKYCADLESDAFGFVKRIGDTMTGDLTMSSGKFKGDLTGKADTAAKLDTETAGDATNPVYFADGIPKACTHSLSKDVPADAVFTDTKYTNMGAASADAAGTAGLVPAPTAGAQNKYLRGDGTWAEVKASGGTDIISDEFSAEKVYETGDYCIYDNKLYRFTAKHEVGEWTGEDAEETTAAVELSKLNGNISFPDGQGFYPDVQDGVRGYNTSPARGADTFVPFFSGKRLLAGGAGKGNQTYKFTPDFSGKIRIVLAIGYWGSGDRGTTPTHEVVLQGIQGDFTGKNDMMGYVDYMLYDNEHTVTKGQEASLTVKYKSAVTGWFFSCCFMTKTDHNT